METTTSDVPDQRICLTWHKDSTFGSMVGNRQAEFAIFLSIGLEGPDNAPDIQLPVYILLVRQFLLVGKTDRTT